MKRILAALLILAIVLLCVGCAREQSAGAGQVSGSSPPTYYFDSKHNVVCYAKNFNYGVGLSCLPATEITNPSEKPVWK